MRAGIPDGPPRIRERTPTSSFFTSVFLVFLLPVELSDRLGVLSFFVRLSVSVSSKFGEAFALDEIGVGAAL